MSSFTTPATQKKLILAVNSLFLIGLAYLLASLGWKLIPIDPTLFALPTQTHLASTQTNKQITPQAQSEITNKALLFGGIDQVEAPPPEPKIAPVTPLNLILKGIFASAGLPRVIISGNNREDNVYAIDDVLPGNAKLIEIYSDRVILLRNGQKETLYLPKDQLPAGSTLSLQNNSLPPPSSLRAVNSYESNHRSSPTSTSTSTSTSTFNNNFTTDNTTSIDATDIRKAFMNNPASLLDYGRASPANQGGRQIGYRIYAGKMQGQLARYGIQAGDIITSVNNIPLNGPQSISQLMSVVSRSHSAQVELLRNGTPITKNFQLK